MKRFCKFLFFVWAVSAFAANARAGIVDDVRCLSDSLMEGRAHASRGAVEAASYICRRLSAVGYQTSLQTFRTGKGVGRNIIAVHKGDPRSDRYILVCAHYDGLGMMNGRVYPGADCNASGVAVLLFLAEELKTSGKNFVFAALDAHYQDLAGATALSESGLWTFSMVVNLDTVGSTLAPPNKYRPDFMIVLGGKQYEKSLEEANCASRLRLYYDYYRSKSFTDYFYSKISDQAPFLAKKVPAVMFTSGITMNTNKTTDSAQTLDYDILDKRSVLILNWLCSLKIRSAVL